jgi:hypothetical protein
MLVRPINLVYNYLFILLNGSMVDAVKFGFGEVLGRFYFKHVRPINKTQLKIELNRRGFSLMPISLIILKCLDLSISFGSVRVPNIKYFSTSPFSSPQQASGGEKDETYIIEFLPSILDKDKKNFLSSLKTVLLSLMKEPTPKILSYKLEFCLQTLEDVNEGDETPEYLKSLGIDKHVLELNEM